MKRKQQEVLLLNKAKKLKDARKNLTQRKKMN